MRLAAQRTFHRAGTPLRRCALAPALTTLNVLFCFASRGLRSRALFRGRQFYSGPPRFRKSDGDRLLGAARTVFAFPNVVDLLAHEFARLGRWRFALGRVAPRSCECRLFWHTSFLACANQRTG